MRVPIVGIGLARLHGRRASIPYLRFPLAFGVVSSRRRPDRMADGGPHSLRLDSRGAAHDMASTLLALGVFALASIALAAIRWKPARIPFFVWNLFVAAVIVRAFVAPSFRFDGTDHFLYSSIVLTASLLGVLGSWDHFRGPSPRPLEKTTIRLRRGR